MSTQTLSLIGQLNEFEKSDFFKLFEELRARYQRNNAGKALPSFEESLRGCQRVQPQDESRTYLWFLGYLLERCDLIEAYQDAFACRAGRPAPKDIEDSGDWGILAAKDALYGIRVR